MSRNASPKGKLFSSGEALRDLTKDGCEGDLYVTGQIKWQSKLEAKSASVIKTFFLVFAEHSVFFSISETRVRDFKYGIART